MTPITTIAQLKKQDVILMGYKKKRKFKFREQFEYYRNRSKEEKEEYLRFWEYCIKEGVLYEI